MSIEPQSIQVGQCYVTHTGKVRRFIARLMVGFDTKHAIGLQKARPSILVSPRSRSLQIWSNGSYPVTRHLRTTRRDIPLHPRFERRC